MVLMHGLIGISTAHRVMPRTVKHLPLNAITTLVRAVLSVGADVENGEVRATSSFIARLVAEEPASAGDSCFQSHGRPSHLFLLLICLFAVVTRRRAV